MRAVRPELSSFQLETTSSLHAAAATILNVTEDHMDRYPFGLQQYRAAKLRVYENAKVCVVNADDALTMPVRGADDRCISFGINMVTITLTVSRAKPGCG